LTFIC